MIILDLKVIIIKRIAFPCFANQSLEIHRTPEPKKNSRIFLFFSSGGGGLKDPTSFTKGWTRRQRGQDLKSTGTGRGQFHHAGTNVECGTKASRGSPPAHSRTLSMHAYPEDAWHTCSWQRRAPGSRRQATAAAFRMEEPQHVEER